MDKLRNTIEQLIEGIQNGSHKILCEYSQDKEKMKAFNDGQISALKLILLGIDYGLYSEDGKLKEFKYKSRLNKDDNN